MSGPFDEVMKRYGLPALEPDPRTTGTGSIEERLAAVREILGVGDKGNKRSGDESDGESEEAHSEGNRDIPPGEPDGGD